MTDGLKVLTYKCGVADIPKYPLRNRSQCIRLALELCRNADAEPRTGDDLDRGIAMLRRLPTGKASPEEQMARHMEWPLAGLMHWAAATNPTTGDFGRVWDDIRQLYPRAPGSWEREIGKVAEKYPDLWVVAPYFGYLLHPKPSIAEVREAGTIYVAKRRRLGVMPPEIFALCA